MGVIIYMASVSSSLELKKNQERIFSVLSSKKIPFKAVDITQNSEDKDVMRKKAGNPKALPPQIFNGDAYCGVRFIHPLREFKKIVLHEGFTHVLHLAAEQCVDTGIK
ncbi:hypothetical protein AMECASPLE_033860 [Ameca splendens]|uniref:Uncharacterized protein n=1 Tax=Ameca splendens TaxID=208324 RepID=A0ABV1AFZ2_9TELE